MLKEVGVFFFGKPYWYSRNINFGASGDYLGKFMLVWVNIDISKPLKRVFRVTLDGKTVTILLHCEWLPNFYGFYGRLGHVVGTCLTTHEDALASSRFGT
ncbi:hypothetical protein ACOSQ3_023204 [Xanthoceras sorbifolium]